MANCENCGNDHPTPEQSTAATIAWADQFRSEFRDTARAIHSQAIAATGETICLTQEEMEAMDAAFAVGASAMAIVLGRHGALKRAEW